MPRFDYEGHVDALVRQAQLAGLRPGKSASCGIVIEYQSQHGYERKLTLDIVDYPGEWLLDLPLLDKSYEAWSAESLAAVPQAAARARSPPIGTPILRRLKPEGAADEQAALTAARLFTEYLKPAATRITA